MIPDRFFAILFVLLGLAAAAPVWSAPVEVSDAWARATLPGQKVAGVYMKLRSAAGAKLVGVDLSPHMLALARRKQLYDVLFEADIEEYLSQIMEEFDLITASGVLIFFGDLNPVLAKIHQALKPRGMLIATLYQSESTDVSIRDNIHFAHSELHIREAAMNNGLEILELSPVVHEYDKGQPQAGYLLVLCCTDAYKD